MLPLHALTYSSFARVSSNVQSSTAFSSFKNVGLGTSYYKKKYIYIKDNKTDFKIK